MLEGVEGNSPCLLAFTYVESWRSMQSCHRYVDEHSEAYGVLIGKYLLLFRESNCEGSFFHASY